MCDMTPGFSLERLQDLAVGQSLDFPSENCTPSITGAQPGGGLDKCNSRGFSFPQNNEFAFALGTNCSMCGDVWDYGCASGSCPSGLAQVSVGGQKCAVQRLAYLADPTQCCIKGTATMNGKTCDPLYRGPLQTACQPKLNVYCDNANTFLQPVCKTWLQNLAKADPGTANNIAFKYCVGNSDPFCACYNVVMPPDLKPSAQGIFRCLDPTCGGSQKALNTLTCPNIYQDCSIKNVDVALTSSTVDKVSVANNCCAGTNCPASASLPASVPVPSGGAPAKAPIPITSIILGVTVLIIVAILLFMVFSASQKATFKKMLAQSRAS